MNRLQRALVLLFLAVNMPSNALWARGHNELVGTWIVESVAPQGMIPQTVQFTKAGEKISGVWSYWPRLPNMEIRIEDVTLEGKQLSFWEKFDPCPESDAVCRRGVLWKGKFEAGDSFTMTWVGADGVPVRSRIFRRASMEDL